jgi:hypothetical protein
MSRLFFNMGYISNPNIVEYSATDLIAQYLGQTRYRTREKLTDALGRFLVINDIHHLLDGPYETQALDELVQFLSEPTNHRNIVVVLSGDEKSINEVVKSPKILNVFRESISFKNIPPDDCITLLGQELGRNGFSGTIRFVRNPTSSEYEKLRKLFCKMQSMIGWNNAYDIKHLASQVALRLLEMDNLDDDDLLASTVMDCIEDYIRQRNELEARAESQEPHIREDIQDQSHSGWGPNSVPWPKESRSTPQPRAHRESRYKLVSGFSTDIERRPVIEQSTSGSWEPAASSVPGSSQAGTATNTFCCARRDKRENDAEEDIVAKREEGISDGVWSRVQEAVAAEKAKRNILKELDEDLQAAGDALVQGTGTN